MNNLTVKLKVNKKSLMKLAHVDFKANRFETFGMSLKNSWKFHKNLPTFNDFYTLHYNKTVSFMFYKTQNIGISEEFSNDIFIKINDIYSTFDYSINTMQSYLNTSIYNKLTDYYRSKAKKFNDRETYISEYEHNSDKNTYDIADNTNDNDNETYNNIIELFNTLNETHKTIAKMYFIDEMKYKEIAVKLNIPMGTIQNYIFNIRKKLQTKIKENNIV